MKSVKHGFVVVLLVIFLMASAVAWFIIKREMDYAHFAFYKDTGLAALSIGNNSSSWQYANTPGHLTLVFTRGRPHSAYTSAHGWTERMSIEWTSNPSLGKVILQSGSVRVGYMFSEGHFSRVMGDKGAQGSIDIESIDGNQIVANYDIIIDTFSESSLPEFQHKSVSFQGRSHFYLETPEQGTIAALGNVIPK